MSLVAKQRRLDIIELFFQHIIMSATLVNAVIILFIKRNLNDRVLKVFDSILLIELH